MRTDPLCKALSMTVGEFMKSLLDYEIKYHTGYNLDDAPFYDGLLPFAPVNFARSSK